MSDGGNIPHEASKIGRTLELARKERGLSFKEVEEATKIRAGYLQELERENFDVLPAVYVQGSLKTYANYLQLDGEALVQELKRRQAPRQEPAYVEPSKDAPDLPTIPLATATVVDSPEAMEDGEDAGWTSVSAGINHYLYLGAGAFLVLVVVILAFALAGDRPPAVSQVREPLISQAPPEAAPVENKEDDRPQPRPKEESRGAEDRGDAPQREQAAVPPHQDVLNESVARTAQTWQVNPRLAEGSRAPAAIESAPQTAEPQTAAPQTAEPQTAAPQTAEPQTAAPQTAAPATASPQPIAEQPVQSSSPNGPAQSPNKRHSPSRDDGGFDVRVTAGSDDAVHITGEVPGD
jgi:cytoskeletal protein RodZ